MRADSLNYRATSDKLYSRSMLQAVLSKLTKIKDVLHITLVTAGYVIYTFYD